MAKLLSAAFSNSRYTDGLKSLPRQAQVLACVCRALLIRKQRLVARAAIQAVNEATFVADVDDGRLVDRAVAAAVRLRRRFRGGLSSEAAEELLAMDSDEIADIAAANVQLTIADISAAFCSLCKKHALSNDPAAEVHSLLDQLVCQGIVHITEGRHSTGDVLFARGGGRSGAGGAAASPFSAVAAAAEGSSPTSAGGENGPGSELTARAGAVLQSLIQGAVSSSNSSGGGSGGGSSRRGRGSRTFALSNSSSFSRNLEGAAAARFHSSSATVSVQISLDDLDAVLGESPFYKDISFDIRNGLA